MRSARGERRTRETHVKVELNIDGSGKSAVKTGIAFFDHMLGALATHGLLDLKVDTKLLNSNGHHIVEDVGIVLGKALDSALGDRRGIKRFGDALVPMDDSLALVAIDLGGRSYAVIDVDFKALAIEGMPTDLIIHFLETLAANGKFGFHASLMRGRNDHHKAEALFKALGVALCSAVLIEPRAKGRVLSQKGFLK
ncbi:MAG: imidazoleglycerol-phosphate dehydratase HisB [Candidatus Bathyarchaeia archaeon]